MVLPLIFYVFYFLCLDELSFVSENKYYDITTNMVESCCGARL